MTSQPRTERAEPCTERADRAAARTGLFAVSLLSMLLVTGLDLPWRLSGLAFGAVTIYAGVRLLVDLHALRQLTGRTPRRIGVITGIGLTGVMMLVLMGEAALYPLFADQDRCVSAALTHQDRQECRQEFARRQAELLRRWGAEAATTR